MNITTCFFLRVLLVIFLTVTVLVGAAGCGTEVSDGSKQPTDAEPPLPSLQNAPDAAIDVQGAVPGNKAAIESVEIMIMESFPVQVNVVISGTLPDSCSAINQVNQARNGDMFVIAVGTVHQTGVMCAEQTQPFKESVLLDVAGLPAGSYTVTATGSNSVSNSFALTVDNNAPQPPPTPDIVGASITGIVWDDSCILQDDGSPTTGCVSDGAGAYQADGLFSSSEARIPGVVVQLKAGECPGSDEAIGFVITDDTGTFFFPDCGPVPTAS